MTHGKFTAVLYTVESTERYLAINRLGTFIEFFFFLYCIFILYTPFPKHVENIIVCDSCALNNADRVFTAIFLRVQMTLDKSHPATRNVAVDNCYISNIFVIITARPGYPSQFSIDVIALVLQSPIAGSINGMKIYW